MRLLAAGLLALALAPAGAAAQTGGAGPGLDGSGTGGASPARPIRAHVSARLLAVTPATARPGATLTVTYRVDAPGRRVRVRLTAARAGETVARLDLGRRRTHRRGAVRWAPDLAPGRYAVRVRAGGDRSPRAWLEVLAPAPAPAPAPVTSGIFPVQGAWSLGGEDARFGAPRPGRSHQGQDVLAADGTPLVSPVAGTVTWRAYQAGGAGHYTVIRGTDGRDYVFMHLQDGSLLVEKGQAVATGQRIASVGSSGASTGPHLHFEIWPDGWWAPGSEPIDPLPTLLAWSQA